MSKAHEEEWAPHLNDAGGWVASRNGEGPIVATALGNDTKTQQERACLIAAAPDMARALLRRQQCEVYGPCARCEEETMAALRKAGAL